MKEIEYSKKRVAVLGLGRSGEAAARFLLAAGAQVTVLDSGDAASRRDVVAELSACNVEIILGNEALRCSRDFDLAILSPGINPESAMVQNLVKIGVPIVGEIEMAYRACRCPVIAITGTNGKTTTTGLIAAMIRSAGKRVEACGNIGLPFCEVASRSAELDVAVVEVSSFQLEGIQSFRPQVAVWTNFSPNHLDRYPDVEAYYKAKLRIFENQTSEDIAVVNAQSELPELEAEKLTFSSHSGVIADMTLGAGDIIHHEGKPLLAMAETRLRGPHNAENVMAALMAANCLGIPFIELLAGAKAYTPPPHRCEFVGERGGVVWINDSKSTTLDSLEQALRGYHGNVILIAGGKNKGFDFSPLASLVKKHVREAVLIGEMRNAIASDWGEAIPCHPVSGLAEAVEKARELAKAGETVLFSPGTSSYDMFRDYEERGEAFKQLIQ